MFLRGEDGPPLQATNELVDPKEVPTSSGPAIATAGGSPMRGRPLLFSDGTDWVPC